jgi:outer membrane protein assembly factor BamA
MLLHKHWAFAVFPLIVLCSLALPTGADSTTVDNGSLTWAYGWVVDSITVDGNQKTKTFAILREMEIRPGDVLTETAIERDSRYLEDFGLFASITINADSLDVGRCALRIHVIERSVFFLKMIVPILNYDFDRKGFEYGVKWDDRNFRGRKENLGISFKRDAQDNSSVSFGWSAPWLGWRHIGVSAGFSYFLRADTLESFSTLRRYGLSGSVAYPLSDSRINLAQVVSRLSVDRRWTGIWGREEEEQVYLAPLLGLLLDSRNSRLKPTTGQYFFVSVLMTRSITGDKQLYYQLNNDVRLFRSPARKQVIGLQSNLLYQFGDFPEYSSVSIGGPSTVRGYPDGHFRGWHRWYQSAEWRYALLPKKIFRLPIVKFVDIGIHTVVFFDAGIVWKDESEFQLKRFHSGAGFGLRLYSPYQDVVRLDLGFNRHGDVFPYFKLGIRF